MTTFKQGATIGECYGPAMEITEQAQADEYFADLVNFGVAESKRRGENDSREHIEHVQRVNLGYYAGYYDHETRVRVERLFRCAHPVFGAIATNGAPTPDGALEAGRKAAAP